MNVSRLEPGLKDQATSIASEIMVHFGHGRALVAVDGRHGAGQKEFARALANLLSARGAKVFVAYTSDFMHPRAYRKRAEQLDGAAQYRDTFDYSMLRRVLIEPFRTSGSTSFVLTGFDERRNKPVFQPKWMSAGPDAILIIAGVYLHRPELAEIWDYSIWLTNSPHASLDHALEISAQSDEVYLADASPSSAATILINNEDPANPSRVRED